MNKMIIACIIGIVAVLAVVFLSQQSYFKGSKIPLISNAANLANEYMAKGSNWAMSNLYAKVSGQVQSGGDIIQNGVDQTKEKIEKISDSAKNIPEKISNYFSGIGNSILGKENNNCNCQTPPAQTTSGQ